MKGVRVNVVEGSSVQEVAQRVNDWLEANPTLDVVDIKATSTRPHFLCAMIIYHPASGDGTEGSESPMAE